MRLLAQFLVPALLALLSACSTNPQLTAPKIDQKGVLKVHPGLLGQPVPPELREQEEKRVAKADSANDTTTAGTSTDGRTPVGKDAAPPSTLGSFYFDFKEAKIKTEHQSLIDAHVARLKASRKAVLRIEGHADERGPDGFNKVLGFKRAQAVKQALLAKGVRPAQIKLVSYGKSRPKVKGHDEASWAENRRADLVVERE